MGGKVDGRRKRGRIEGTDSASERCDSEGATCRTGRACSGSHRTLLTGGTHGTGASPGRGVASSGAVCARL
eukprot:1012499-Rhodomonas_salina.1